MKVELLDEQGQVLPGYGRKDCVALNSDSVNVPVSWRGTSQLPETEKPLRIRFILCNAELYSFNVGGGVEVSEL